MTLSGVAHVCAPIYQTSTTINGCEARKKNMPIDRGAVFGTHTHSLENMFIHSIWAPSQLLHRRRRWRRIQL